MRALVVGSVLACLCAVAGCGGERQARTSTEATGASFADTASGTTWSAGDPTAVPHATTGDVPVAVNGDAARPDGSQPDGQPGPGGATATSLQVTPGISSSADDRANYGEARELAREGEFDRAERILERLAASDTPYGRNARRYLAFDFHYEKMHWLLQNQHFTECAETGRALLKRDLTPSQTDKVEALLDRVRRIDGALGQAERAAALGACRHVMMVLAQRYAEDDGYPDALSISDFEEQGMYADPGVLMGLSAIEDYTSTGRSYSLVAVSSKGRHRVRIVDGVIRP